MDHLRRDLRHTLRVLRRAPVFTLTVLLTLGLGIGANAAIFGFVDAMLLRPLPYAEPEEMVMVWEDFGSTGGPVQEWLTPPDYADLTEVQSLEAVTMLMGWGPNLTGVSEPVRLVGLTVSTEYFDVVGEPPMMGRGFEAADADGDGRVVVISSSLWKSSFGAAPDVVGRTIRLNDMDYTVVGVMPESFRAPFRNAEIWRPNTRTLIGSGCGRGCYVMQVMGRIREGVSLEQARSEVAALGASIVERFPGEKAGMELVLVPLHEQLAGPTRPALYALLGGVGLLLLIACVNIANLLVARADVREREIAVRAAIGASRGLVLRQLLTESVVLGMIGGAIGVLVAYWGVDLLVAMSPVGTPRLDEVAVSGRVLGFAALLSIATGIVFGLLPSVHLSRVDLGASLKETGGLRAGVSRRRARSALVVAEIALALTLLTGAGLLVRSMVRLTAVDAGFRAEDAVAVTMQLAASRYPDDAAINTFYATLLERVGARPGVVAVGAASILPLTGNNTDVGVLLEGRPLPATREEALGVNYRTVTPGYFDAMGMRLLRGRPLSEADRAGAPLVVVINQTMAQRFWPNEDAIGKRLTTEGQDGAWVEVVGIVADVRHDGLAAPVRPEMWVPYGQLPDNGLTLVARTEADPLALVPSVRAELRTLDAEIPVGAITTLDALVAQSVAVPRLFVAFFTFFAAVALLLAAVGIFGVTQHAVVQRSQEIGIRIALGARAGDVLLMVLRQSLLVTAVGLVLGLALGLTLSRQLTALLFETSPFDPLTYAAIVTILALVAFVATWLPARHAARVDPVVALRAE